jgi:hypothetical protein
MSGDERIYLTDQSLSNLTITSFRRPQVSYGAYDQPTYYVDVTPFLGILSDDGEHKFQLKVVSAEKNQTVLSWFISGELCQERREGEREASV